MSQIFRSSTESGALRFVPREAFALQSYPQASCAGCRWRPFCRESLESSSSWPENFWLVRDPYLASSDGMTVIDQCGRTFTDFSRPADVTVLNHRETAAWMEEFVARPGEPVKRPREARHGARRRAVAFAFDLDEEDAR